MIKKRKLNRRGFLQTVGASTSAIVAGPAILNAKTKKPSSKMSVVDDYDVIVCGGGTAGFPAAVGAARQGARVAVIERYGFMGGVPAYSIMPAWHGLISNQSGFLTEFAQKVDKLNVGPNPLENRHIEPEVAKHLFLTMSLDEGVDLFLHHFIKDVKMDGNRIDSVITQSKSGQRAFKAKTFIDATGDGDVCYYAGADYHKGDDGKMQGYTLRFRIGWVDLMQYLDFAKEHLQYYRGRTAEQIESIKKRAKTGLDFYLGSDLSEIWKNHPDPELPANTYFVVSSIRPGEVSINSTRIYGVDGTDADDLTKSEITCRKQAWAIWRYLRENIPGFKYSAIVETGAQIGVRESREIVGDYILTDSDMRKMREFDDSIITSPITYDAHDKEKYDTFHIHGGMVDIPYRCYLPKNIEGLLVAGRCISSDHLANSSIRQMRTAFQGGEACGISAGMSANNNTTPRNLVFSDLLNELKANGLMTSQRHRREEGRHLMQFYQNNRGSNDYTLPEKSKDWVPAEKD